MKADQSSIPDLSLKSPSKSKKLLSRKTNMADFSSSSESEADDESEADEDNGDSDGGNVTNQKEGTKGKGLSPQKTPSKDRKSGSKVKRK